MYFINYRKIREEIMKYALNASNYIKISVWYINQQTCN